jgi:hypothetical protein
LKGLSKVLRMRGVMSSGSSWGWMIPYRGVHFDWTRTDGYTPGLARTERALYASIFWAIECTYKWLNRRGGKRRSFTWKALTQALDRLGVAKPRITELGYRHVVFT